MTYKDKLQYLKKSIISLKFSNYMERRKNKFKTTYLSFRIYFS